MSGEINGTNVILRNTSGDIVGQMEMTLTYNGTPIDVSNKSAGDNVTLLDANLAGKQLQISGNLVYNDDDQYRKVRSDALTGTQDSYVIEYTSDATTDEGFTCTMTPNGLSDAIPHGDKISTTLTFLSSGSIVHTPAA